MAEASSFFSRRTRVLERRTSFFFALASAVLLLTPRAARAQTAVPKVEAVYPHDTTAFTEGLEVFEGKLYESTGLTGKSVIRRVDITTGTIEKNQPLDSSLFGEGLTRVDRTLINLTYTTGIAIVFDIDTFAEVKRFTYTGQGWGLCYDGADLLMTNGSDTIFFRDPVTFAIRREVKVQRNGTSISNLNELECVGSLVYINQWKTDNILRVDKATGNVVTMIDGSMLLTADEKKNVDVLNGIAYDPAKRRFYLTGKYWPKLFEVSFDFEPGGEGDAGIDGGGTIDAGPPRDAGRDAASDGAIADTGASRDAGGERVTDSGARDASTGDRASDTGAPPPSDATTPPDSSSTPDGAGGAGGNAGAGGSGGFDLGNDTPEEGCACRSSQAPRHASWPVSMAVFGAALYALRRSARPRRRARVPVRSR